MPSNQEAIVAELETYYCNALSLEEVTSTRYPVPILEGERAFLTGVAYFPLR